jgi:serine/threonine-protein kinase
MNPCPSLERLWQFLADQVAGPDAEILENHVQGCCHCQDELERITQENGLGQARQEDLFPCEDHSPMDGSHAFLRWLEQNPPGTAGLAFRDFKVEPTLNPRTPSSQRAAAAGAIPGYEILDELGRGGMGVVYRARQKNPNRLVALKTVLAGANAGAEMLARFQTEINAAAQLQHPNIVQIFEVGEQDGRPFFSMELAPGGTLAQKLRGIPFPVRPSAQLVETLARAIHHAHQHGIVHRDLKPANILLVSGGVVSGELSGETPLTTQDSPLTTPKITDFGLAKILTDQRAVSGLPGQTQSGAIMGTPSYMSPEQASGRTKAIGPAADIYALGAILYEMLTGRPPFRAESSLETLQQVLSQDPVPPRLWQPKVPHDLETVCLKCLEKEPRQRYADAEALAEDLRRFLAGEPVWARRTPLWERAWKWAHRRPVAAASLAISSLAVAFLLAGWMLFTVQLQAARDRADENATRFQQQKEEAEKQWHRAETNYARALQAVDELLTRVGESRLTSVPEMDRVRQDLLQEALRHCQAFLRESDSPDPHIRRETGLAYQRTARIKSLLGEREQACEDLRQAVALQKQLVNEFGDQALYRQDLAKSHHNLGIYGRNDTQAEEAYRQALDLKEQLVREEEQIAEHRASLAKTLVALGILYRRTNRTDSAEKTYRRAIELQERLTQEQPQESEHQDQLANTYYNLGILYRQTARLEEACQVWSRALALREELVKRHSQVLAFQRNLANSYNVLAVGHQESGRMALAAETYLKAVALNERLARDHPAIPDYQWSLAVNHANLGRLYLAFNEPGPALAASEKALGILKPLVHNYPRTAEYRYELAKTYVALAETCIQEDQPSRGQLHLREAQGLLEPLHRDYPNQLEYAIDLGVCYHNLGRALHKDGRPAEAVTWCDRALLLAQEVLTHNADYAKARMLRNQILQDRARSLEQLKDSAENRSKK